MRDAVTQRGYGAAVELLRLIQRCQQTVFKSQQISINSVFRSISAKDMSGSWIDWQRGDWICSEQTAKSPAAYRFGAF
jgi:hypothetical protein